MKKLSALFLSLLMLTSCLAVAETGGGSATVYVSVTDAENALVMAYVPVCVTDVDADGTLTLRDALDCAHAACFPDGAEGFACAVTEYGLSMTRLWGVENGGSYGYCLNDAPAWSLADPVKDGDHVKAYVYTDLTAWSDTYCFFAAPATQSVSGAEVSLTLSANGYDEMWNPVVLPVSGAVLTVNGEATASVTGEDGTAVLTFAAPGTYLVSAVSDAQTLVAPVCIVTVTAAE